MSFIDFLHNAFVEPFTKSDEIATINAAGLRDRQAITDVAQARRRTRNGLPLMAPVAAGSGSYANTAPRPFSNEINASARKYGLNPRFLDAVAFAESSYNPKAVSKSGAVGLTQLTPVALKDIGWQGKPTDLYNPATNLDLGAQYLKKIYQVRSKQLGRAPSPLEWYHAFSFGPYNSTPISPAYESNFNRAYNR
jgi:soluble lytic murein transglycosylase-like protein